MSEERRRVCSKGARWVDTSALAMDAASTQDQVQAQARTVDSALWAMAHTRCVALPGGHPKAYVHCTCTPTACGG